MQQFFTRLLLVLAWMFLLLPFGYAQVLTPVGGTPAPSTCSACYGNGSALELAGTKVAAAKQQAPTAFAAGSTPTAYVHSVNLPWGTAGNDTNVAAVNGVFGTGSWNDLTLEATDAATIFTATRQTVFLEGSDVGVNALNAFLQANRSVIENWVAAGGHLLLNAAPNQGSSIDFGFGGITLNYGNRYSYDVTVTAGHPVATGPYLPAGNSYSGNYFAHATVSGPGLTTVISGGAGIVLGFKAWGSGYVFLGGMTTTNFHLPQPNALNLRKNVLAFTTPCVRPVVTAPSIAVNNAPGQCNTSVNLPATATQGGALTYTLGGSPIASPYSFPVGTSTVTATATNACGADAKTFTVTVTDTEQPVLTVPTNIVTNAPATQCGAVVTFSPVATDNCTIAKVVASPGSGSTFPVGTSTVTVTATDASGNTSTGSFTVTVNDATAPTVATRTVSVTLVNGTASVAAADVNNGSTDACGIATYSLNRTNFNCANWGNNAVVLTVTDIHGNTASAPATVVVVGSIPAPAITVAPASSVYTGGIATNLYLGYGSQSATLTATGGLSYAWSPAKGLSDAAVPNPVFTAATAGTFTYTVTATNQYGCTATATVTLRVIDARCDKGKVMVCHNGHEICISPNAVPAHLTGHAGDQLGTCGTAARPATTNDAATAARDFLFEAYPNPFGASTTVHFRPTVSAVGQLRVFDAMGRVVSTLFAGTTEAGHDYSLTLDASRLAAGLYQCRYESQGMSHTQRLSVVK